MLPSWVRNLEWISVAHAASLMGVCHRQALRLLGRLDVELDGRLMRRIGVKRMPGGVQASKYLVSVTILREALRPNCAVRDLESLRLEMVVLRQQLQAIRRAVRTLLRLGGVADAT